MPCHSIPDLDLSHWREEVTQCRVNGQNIAIGASRKISPCTSCTCTKEGVSSVFTIKRLIVNVLFVHFQAQCQSLKINNCPQLILEFGEEAVSRDNICKTQCSFVLNGGAGNILGFDPFSDTLQAPLPSPGTLQPPPPPQQQQQQLPPQRSPPPRHRQQQQQPPRSTPITQPIRPPRPPNPPSLFSGIRPPPPPPVPPAAPLPPRAPRPPNNVNGGGLPFGANNNNAAAVAAAGGGPRGDPGGGQATSASEQQASINNPNRQPRPLFSFLPRLPNLSEIFGL